MESLQALRGQTRSMSSLGPILPLMYDIRQMSASTPPSVHEESRLDLLDESQIPLPSSIPSSPGVEEEHFDSRGLEDLDDADGSLPCAPRTDIRDETDLIADSSEAQKTEQIRPLPAIWNDTTQEGDVEDPDPEIAVPLLDLLEAMEDDEYQTRRLRTLQDEAYGLFHKCGSCDRFLTVQTHLYRRMVECFRTDKKNAFASLYSRAMSHPNFADLEVPRLGLEENSGAINSPSLGMLSGTSWIQRLPLESQHSLMEFLARIRTDPLFVAERISKLSETQLKRLTRPHRQHAPVESTSQTSRSHGRYDPRGFQRSMAKPSDQAPSVDELMGDPLMLLIHGLFDPSGGPRSAERLRQLDVWSSVCCKLIENSKPGSDEFCITVLNAFAETADWPLVPKLELFLAETAISGSQFLESLSARGVDYGHAQPSPPTDASARVSAFFDRAINSFLDLIVTDCAQAMPDRALEMIRSILHKIQNQERRLTARNFFFLRWYCASFLYNAMVFPETHSMMMDHSISSSDRQNIFRELLTRLQKVITDVLSPWSSTPVAPALESKIRKLLQSIEQNPPTAISSDPGNSDRQERFFLFLRPEDVLAVARSLSSEVFSDSGSNSVFEQPQSRASSLSGFPSLASGPLPSNLGDSPYPQSFSMGNPPQSYTWHTQSFGGRPSVSSIGFPSFDRSRSTRPGSSPGFLSDMEKDSPPPFTHDLWLITANREFEGPAPYRGHEAVVLFVDESKPALSLSPLQESTAESNKGSLHGDIAAVQAIHEGDRRLLTAAITRIAESFRKLKQGLPRVHNSLESLRIAFGQLMQKSRLDLDPQTEYFWWNCIRTLNALDAVKVSRFLAHLYQRCCDSMKLKQNLGDQYEEWLYNLRQRSSSQDQVMQKMSLSSQRLRNKMWYVSDVKHSSAYEDAYNVTRTLRAMVEPAEQKAYGMTAWAKQRIRNSFGHERVLSQTLELMTAPKTYGGPKKLSESQVQITTEWLLTNSIENFCRGEERIHRFCYEIQKCVKRLAGEAMLETPVLWSSVLFQNEKAEHGIPGSAGQRQSQEPPSWRTDFSYPHTWNRAPNLPGSSPNLTFQDADNSMGFHAGVSNLNTSPQAFTVSPNTQHRAPLPRNWALPPSPISPGNIKTSNEGSSLRRRAFLQNLRSHLTSLLLSDLGSILWAKGSETDLWVNGIGLPLRANAQSRNVSAPEIDSFRRLASPNVNPDAPLKTSTHDDFQDPTLSGHVRTHDSGVLGQTSQEAFPFSAIFKTLIKRFRLSPNPQSKLQYLYELFLLAGYHCQAERFQVSLAGNQENKDRDGDQNDMGDASVVGLGVPRTRLTRLQEVAANCEDRRQGSLANSRSVAATPGSHPTALPAPRLNDSSLIALVKSMFASDDYRPSTFFRDLQFIAALTPSSILDYTPQGTAFWTVGLAAMSVKSSSCKSMTDEAMQILEYHYGNSHQKEPGKLRRGSQGMTAAAAHTISQVDLFGSTLQDAARLLTVSALEGDPTAARELALFHLTHPELVSRVTLPLSRPSDVFRAKHGGAAERGHRGGNGEDSGVLDPITFAVVFHWMEFAANAGDADAITFWKENGGLGTAL